MWLKSADLEDRLSIEVVKRDRGGGEPAIRVPIALPGDALVIHRY